MDPSNVHTEANLFQSELVQRRARLERAVARNRNDGNLVQLLSEVDAALRRIEKGTFGLCETCGAEIEHDRLLADPLVRYCLEDLSPGEQRALEQDLHLAAEIQRGLLPQRDIATTGWEIAHHFAPAGPVSGDYVDVVLPREDEGHSYFLLGDVSGKGVAASLLMANLHATFRSLLATHQPVEALMERANRLFCESTLASQYATLVCAKASPDGDVEIANAGHCPVLVASGGRTRVMESGGLPLGMFCGSKYETERCRLDPGDLMLLYTDGVIEARNGDAEYGQERLVALFDGVDAVARGSARGLAKACLDDLARFLGGGAHHDDVTVMAIRRT